MKYMKILRNSFLAIGFSLFLVSCGGGGTTGREAARLTRLDGEMEQAACDAEKLNELYRRHQAVEAELEREMTRWEELSLQAEEQENGYE